MVVASFWHLPAIDLLWSFWPLLVQFRLVCVVGVFVIRLLSFYFRSVSHLVCLYFWVWFMLSCCSPSLVWLEVTG